DESDEFFDLGKHQKVRSASFAGSTQYSNQLAASRQSLFAPSLDTIGSVASGTNEVWLVEISILNDRYEDVFTNLVPFKFLRPIRLLSHFESLCELVRAISCWNPNVKLCTTLCNGK
ncbi:hypothetical protein Angca_000598, partial [Angiostrongylus cantonensis]